MTEEKAITKAFVIFPVHIDLIKEKAESMGKASDSAGLRAILEEWAQSQGHVEQVTAGPSTAG